MEHVHPLWKHQLHPSSVSDSHVDQFLTEMGCREQEQHWLGVVVGYKQMGYAIAWSLGILMAQHHLQSQNINTPP